MGYLVLIYKQIVERPSECIDLLPTVWHNARQGDENAFRCRRVEFTHTELHYRKAEQIGLEIENFRVCSGVVCCLLYLQRGINKKKIVHGSLRRKLQTATGPGLFKAWG